MKKTILSNKTICNSLIFYRLKMDELTIHLTFDQVRHKKACLKLQQNSFAILQKEDEEMLPNTLKDILQKSTPFNKLAQSFFVKQGTSFQQQVWQLISQIPFGTRRTYSCLAENIGSKNLARAVGQACNANPLALVIPCHRVVGVSGLGGFAGGAEIKEKILLFETSQGHQSKKTPTG